MKQTIEKNVVSISIGTAITVITSVVIMVWSVANMRAEFKEVNSTFNTRLTVVENKAENIDNKFDNLKSDLKEGINNNTKKLDIIYNLLIKR